jgi:hypothetical protein
LLKSLSFAEVNNAGSQTVSFEQKILNTSYPEKVTNSCKLSLLPFRSGAQTYLSLGDEAPSTTVTFSFSLQHFLIRLVCLTTEMGKMFEEV